MPDILKTSKLTPMDKGGDVTDRKNFHPILLLSIFAQSFENLVCKQPTNDVKNYAI